MDESILLTIKKILGVPEDYKVFDVDLIVHINSVLLILQQLGVGPKSGFSITGTEETWSDFFTNPENLEAVKSYVGIKTKLLFDPPDSSFVLDSYKTLANELEWRLNVQVDPGVSKLDG